MHITDVRVRKVSKEGKMKAVVSITIDDEFVVHDIKVIEGEKGLFIAMPSRKASDGEYRDIAHPINSGTRERIQSTILAKYEDNAVNDQAYIDVRYILKDNSPENIERILNALIKWHRKPFLSEGILGTDCKAGLNTTYIYRCLDNLNIWNNNATYERYLQCLATINKVYGNMDIVSSKASISQNLKLIDDEKLNELKNQVSEYLKNKQN